VREKKKSVQSRIRHGGREALFVYSDGTARILAAAAHRVSFFFDSPKKLEVINLAARDKPAAFYCAQPGKSQ
jgi:hypothetical protein